MQIIGAQSAGGGGAHKVLDDTYPELSVVITITTTTTFLHHQPLHDGA